VPPSASIVSASRVRAAGGVPEPMASGATPRERGSAAAFFFRRRFPSLLLGAREGQSAYREYYCSKGSCAHARMVQVVDMLHREGPAPGPHNPGAYRRPGRAAHTDQACMAPAKLLEVSSRRCTSIRLDSGGAIIQEDVVSEFGLPQLSFRVLIEV
jgi:hypothetical protein